MPELRLLRAFVEVAEQLSFTRAAERLYLRQQTVSRMVRDLERELGVELLERTTREVRVTPAGTRLLEEGRVVLRSADAAFAAARATGSGHDGTIDVGATVAIGPTDRADVVRALRRNRPQLSVAFREVTPRDIGDKLRSHRVDCALTRTSAATDESLDRAALRPTPVVVCLPAEHPLVGRDRLRAVDLDGERLLVPSPVGKPYADMLLHGFRAAGAALSAVESHVTGGAVLLAEVDQQKAVAVMPTGTVCPSGVVDIPIEDVALPLFVVWLAGRRSEVVDRLRRAMGRA